MSQDGKVSDRDFVAALRAGVGQYLSAVDQWEAAYQKYYRLPGYAGRNAGDVQAEEQAYNERRRELEALVPRARRLCLRYGLKEPFSSLLRISLGRYAPQERMDSVIGRSERTAVAKCLVELHDACQEWTFQTESGAEPARKESWLRRLVGYFY
jgi:hypothetical protein